MILPDANHDTVALAAFSPLFDGCRDNSCDNQTYPCNACGELFKSKVALRRHETYGCLKNPGNPAYLLRMTALDSQQLGDSDGKSMDSETSCVEPENGIEGEFKCDQCPKSFQWKSNLSRHQITHDEDKRYPCENCDKVFTDPSNLQRHIRSQHVGARCHACSDCGKTFATSSGLKQHQHIHSSVKPFQCEVCLKAYTQFSNLCRHKRMHADCRQQIKCKDCGQAFSTVTSLTKHRRFCEGIRSGMRGMCYPQHASADKLPLATLSPGSQSLPPPGFGPAAFVNMNLYGPRPYHPFFPPIGGHAFPLLQPSLPPGLLGPASLSPSGSLGSNGMASDSPPERDGQRSRSPTSEEDEDRMFNKEDMEEMTYRLNKREADKVRMSDEEDFEATPKKKVKREPGEITPTRCRSPAYRARWERSASPQKRTTPPPSHCVPVKIPLKPSLMATPTKEEPGLQSSMPFDLSVKSERKSPVASHAARRTPSPSASASATDGPLDLSITKKSPKSASSSSSSGGSRSVPHSTSNSDLSHNHNNNNGDSTAYTRSKKEVAEESKVATSAFSKSPVIPEPKYPFPTLGFPFPGAPRFMENFMRSQAMDSGKELSLATAGYPEELSKFLFPRFGLLPGAFPPGFNPLHMLRHDMSKALGGGPGCLQPLLKMDKPGLGSEVAGGGHHLQMPVPVSLPHHVPYPYGPPAMSASPAGGNAGGSASTPAGVVGAGAGGVVGNKSKERYSCKFCGKIFPRSANLTRHLRTHTGEQPYKCKYCDRSFSISSNLQRHVRNIHNKEKPFRCPLCDRSFGQQTNLDRHLKKHEQEGPNVTDSPTAELDGRDDPASYYNEIRSLFARNLDPSAAAAAATGDGGGGGGSAADVSPDTAPLSLLSPRPALPRGDGTLSDAEDEKQSDVTVVDDAEEEEDDVLAEVAEGEGEDEEDLVVADGREGTESSVRDGKSADVVQELDLVAGRDVRKAPLRGPSIGEGQRAERRDGDSESREARQHRAPGKADSPCGGQTS